MLEVIEDDSTKNLAELSLAGDEADNWSNVSNGFTVCTVCNSVGVSFAHQPAAPEDHRSSGTAGSSTVGLLEFFERDSTKNLAELDFAEDKAENGSNVINGSTVWDSVGASLALQPAALAAPEEHRSSGAAGSTKMRMLGLSESDFTKNLKEPSHEEDEAENGYQKDTQENKVTKASNANGALYVFGIWIYYDPRDLREVWTENDHSNSSCLWSSHDAQQDCLSR